jgi:hypothetical protein
MKAYGGNWGIDTRNLTSALDGGEWSASRPCRFIPEETATGTHWTEGWVGPRAGLNTVVKRKKFQPNNNKIYFEISNLKA